MRKLSPMSKFPVSIPIELHRVFKMRCAAEGKLMTEVIRKLVARECGFDTETASPAKHREQVSAR